MKHKKVSKKSVNSSTGNTSKYNSNSSGISYDQLSVSSKTATRKRTDSEVSGGIDEDDDDENDDDDDDNNNDDKSSNHDSLISRSNNSNTSSHRTSRNNSIERNSPTEIDQYNNNNNENENDVKQEFKANQNSEALNLFQEFSSNQQLNHFFNEIIKNRSSSNEISSSNNMVGQNLFLNEFFNLNHALHLFSKPTTTEAASNNTHETRK